MVEENLNNLSSLLHETSSIQNMNSFDSNSFILHLLNDYTSQDPIIKSSSSLQLSKSSLSPVSDSLLLINNTDQITKSPSKTLSDLSFNESSIIKEIPTGAWRLSEAVTSAKDSFIEDKANIHYSSFAIPMQMFCSLCQEKVFTSVTFKSIEPCIWDSFESYYCCRCDEFEFSFCY